MTSPQRLGLGDTGRAPRPAGAGMPQSVGTRLLRAQQPDVASPARQTQNRVPQQKSRPQALRPQARACHPPEPSSGRGAAEGTSERQPVPRRPRASCRQLPARNSAGRRVTGGRCQQMRPLGVGMQGPPAVPEINSAQPRGARGRGGAASGRCPCPPGRPCPPRCPCPPGRPCPPGPGPTCASSGERNRPRSGSSRPATAAQRPCLCHAVSVRLTVATGR